VDRRTIVAKTPNVPGVAVGVDVAVGVGVVGGGLGVGVGVGPGVALDVAKSRVAYGGIVVARGGAGIEHDGVALARHMMGDEVQIEVHLGAGKASAKMIGIDLGPGYIKENSKTS